MSFYSYGLGPFFFSFAFRRLISLTTCERGCLRLLTVVDAIRCVPAHYSVWSALYVANDEGGWCCGALNDNDGRGQSRPEAGRANPDSRIVAKAPIPPRGLGPEQELELLT